MFSRLDLQLILLIKKMNKIANKKSLDVSEYDRWLYRRRFSRLCAYFIIKTSLLVLIIEKFL